MTPVLELIVMPELVGAETMDQVFVPVPESAMNAVEESGVPEVVAIAEPPRIPTIGLTRMVYMVLPVTPRRSVAVIVS